MVPLLWLLLNTVILVFSRCPTLRLQSIQGSNRAWWAEDREGWESRNLLKWEDDPNKEISPFLKRKAQPSCKSCNSDTEGKKKSLKKVTPNPKPGEWGKLERQSLGMDVLCATSSLSPSSSSSQQGSTLIFQSKTG